jgi:hypothetical protein
MSYNKSPKTIEVLSPLLDTMLMAMANDLPSISFSGGDYINAKKLAQNIHSALNSAKELENDKYKHLRDNFQIAVKADKVICRYKNATTKPMIPTFMSFDSITTLSSALDILINNPPTPAMSYVFPSINTIDDFFADATKKLGLNAEIIGNELSVRVSSKEPEADGNKTA